MSEKDDAGFTTVQYVITVGLSLLLLVLVANLLVDLYARGAIRDALDEGVRAGAPQGAHVEVCEARAREVMSGLLRGPIGRDFRIDCTVESGVVRASARGALRSWLPVLVPDWHLELEASMRAEP